MTARRFTCSFAVCRRSTPRGTASSAARRSRTSAGERKRKKALRREQAKLRSVLEGMEVEVAERTAVAERRAASLRRLAAELGHAEHRERQRLAKVLHDDLQQLLLAARLRVAYAGRETQGETVRAEIKAIDELLGECMAASRNLTIELSPPILRRGRFPEVLEWLAEWFREKHGLQVALDAVQEMPPIAEHARAFLFQSVREMLFNVVKHAGVSEAKVALCVRGDCLVVQVEDGGRGFDPQAVLRTLDRSESFGLFNVQERLEALEGKLEIESSPGGGTRMRLILPVAATVEPEPEQAGVAEVPGVRARGKRRRRGSAPIRLLVVDDHKVVREGLVGLLGRKRTSRSLGRRPTARKPSARPRRCDPT